MPIRPEIVNGRVVYVSKWWNIQPRPKVRKRYKSFARDHSDSMWQIDIKKIGDDWLLITILDDHSRFIIACKLVCYAASVELISVLVKAIRMFGNPRQILADHGSQIFSSKGGESMFDAFRRKNGITHILAGVRKPATIEKVER
ncbi:MAG: DDE-type integrase/transposase/recombinase [Thermoplasmata archaeon]|nr:DDE-type integrase/transposase/recombinase [Thermoplasmata archaeon]